jgi:heme-degrading monooxygenase HmoA
MITRIWRGRTTPRNADAYQSLLLSTVFPGIAARNIPGFLGIQLDRRESDADVEFVTTMIFASLDAVIAFAGTNYRTSVVPPAARALLASFDAEADHYELVAGMGSLTPPALTAPRQP